MPLERKCHFGGGHSAAVVGYFDPAKTAFTKPHNDVDCPGIDRIFDQFLERRGRPFNHFPRSDAVDQVFGKAADHGHSSGPSDETPEIRARECIESDQSTQFFGLSLRLALGGALPRQRNGLSLPRESR